uniref:Uncharacterized protein n=1 Tax=Oryza nivara TaxID=4536 RepID=A0A0E0FHL1_ORYNI
MAAECMLRRWRQKRRREYILTNAAHGPPSIVYRHTTRRPLPHFAQHAGTSQDGDAAPTPRRCRAGRTYADGDATTTTTAYGVDRWPARGMYRSAFQGSKGQHSLLAKCRERGSLQGEWEARLHYKMRKLRRAQLRMPQAAGLGRGCQEGGGVDVPSTPPPNGRKVPVKINTPLAYVNAPPVAVADMPALHAQHIDSNSTYPNYPGAF